MSETAFDAVATEYDRDFTATPLARLLREQVWARLGAHFQAGDYVLELNCGTGEDALWLAQRGVQVTATDVSTAMLNVTERKARDCGVSDLIETSVLDLTAPFALQAVKLDGAFSNFGGLNCVNDLQPLAAFLANRIKPRGQLILVPMNRWCAWEIVWHLLHRQFRTAFRRLRRDGVEANVGRDTVHVWYPSIRILRQTFAPHFQLRRVIGLGVWLPPSYLEPVITKRPTLFRRLQRCDQLTRNRWPFSHIADHVILEFERVA
ncbi:MAG: methyltransferase domain-containing protein [Thermoflexales bacterium]|nr:methyltransferase domain-containing protein [Thermoflexales bacterium]